MKMKTITYEQLADFTIAFIDSDETDLESCGVLAEVTTDMLPDEDHEEFMDMVMCKVVNKLLDALA